MAAAQWLYLYRTSSGTKSRRDVQNITTGKSHSFGGEYVELVPNERLRYTDKFDDPNLPGDIQVTVTLKKVSVGTELNVVQEGLPDAIPTEACYLGWPGVVAKPGKARRTRNQLIAYQQSNRGRGRPRQP
jgi:uncharacterized protein YndB with AHSA1/START domain